jgi:hypothetical protein
MQWDYPLWGALAILMLGALAAILWALTRPLPKFPDQKSPMVPLPLEPIHLRFDPGGEWHRGSRAYDDQSDEWKSSLRQSGCTLLENKVSEIILLHGTFVGSDPISMFSSLRSNFPKMSQRIEGSLTRKMRGLIDGVAQDNGNFIPAYAELLKKGLGDRIPVELYYWSSSNHHLGRLEGALGLLQRLIRQRPRTAHERILYIGHSHARQVLALFTQLVNSAGDRSTTGAELWAFVEREGLASEGLQSNIAAMKKRMPKFDFVTLGGPIRYAWCFLPGMKVLHIVNHHGDTSRIPSFWTFWKTNSGDYVQQWGMVGSDSIATTPRERSLNRALDEILGKGWHTRLWLRSIIRRERLGDFGRTLLVDYFHAPRQRTNFIKTVFGHGVYTRFDVMAFQIDLICRYMYGRKK